MDNFTRMAKVNAQRRIKMDNFMIGNCFNYLHVVGSSAKVSKNGTRYYYCQCLRCGNFRCVSGTDLRNGKAKQCKFCTNKTHGKSKSSEYQTWLNMKARCQDKSREDYHLYGGRGITVCKRWKTVLIIF